MNRYYRRIFVCLLTLILAAFLLLFADVGLSSVRGSDLDNGRFWMTRKLRLSAELAYYNHWGSDLGIVEQRENSSLSQQDLEARENNPAPQKPTKVASVSARGSYQQSRFHHRMKHSLPLYVKFNNTATLISLSANNSMKTVVVPGRKVLENEQRSDKAGIKQNDERVIEKSRDFANNTDKEYWDRHYTAEEYEMEETENELMLSELEEMDSQWISETISETADDSLVYEEEGYMRPELMTRATDTDYHMPCPGVYRPTNEIATAVWMKPLLRILSSFEGRQVALVIADDAYRDVLLNWLISARIVSLPPLENIVVVCLDQKLYSLLQLKEIPSIIAPFNSVLNTKHHFRRSFELIMMMRLGFMRIINRLGYDCAMYDIDAIILRNPQPLYDMWDGVDIVGSRGELPKELWRRWGVAICIGAVFIRSNTRTELYWEAVYSAKVKGSGNANDQIRLNYGLHSLHVEWEHSGEENRLHDVPAVGHSGSANLSVVVLPFSQICRFGCSADSRDSYYVWHKGGSRDKQSKMKGAKQGRTWFLREKWSQLQLSVKRTKWLSRISVHTMS